LNCQFGANGKKIGVKKKLVVKKNAGEEILGVKKTWG